MIQRKRFYRPEENLTPNEKTKMWSNIKQHISTGENEFPFIHWRSFSFGVAAVIILFFTVLGAGHFFNEIMYGEQPEIVKVNQAYESAIKNFEKLLPENFVTAGYEINIDEEMSSKIEKLSTIDEAINEMNSAISTKDHSKIKQKRLLDLYQMKLNVIEEIIELEEGES